MYVISMHTRKKKHTHTQTGIFMNAQVNMNTDAPKHVTRTYQGEGRFILAAKMASNSSGKKKNLTDSGANSHWSKRHCVLSL